MKTIETQRTVLRPITLDDVEAFNLVNRLPEVMRYIGPVETDVEQTRAYLIQGPLADYDKYGYGRHACIDKASGRLIGFSGLKYLDDIDDVDIGYRFLPEFWGMGLATETSLVLMDFAKQELGLKRVIGLAMPENHASINVFPKLGMQYEKTINDIYAIDQSEKNIRLNLPLNSRFVFFDTRFQLYLKFGGLGSYLITSDTESKIERYDPVSGGLINTTENIRRNHADFRNKPRSECGCKC